MPPRIRPMTAEDRPALTRLLLTIPEFKPGEVVVAEELVDWFLSDPVVSGYQVAVCEVNVK